jgi:hypothetical protein
VSLRSTPPGTAAALRIEAELDGGIGGFGERFWEVVLNVAPWLGERLASGMAIKEVVYHDRYVRSPLAMRSVIEVLKALRLRSKPAMQGTAVRLVTMPIDHPGHDYKWIWNDWAPVDDRYHVFAAAAAGVGLMGELETLPKYKAPHARELSIQWADGASWTMRLDEGFGFLRSRKQIPYNFAASSASQGAALVSATYEVAARHETHMYVFAIEGGTASQEPIAMPE